MKKLNKNNLKLAAKELARRDEHLKMVFEKYSYPPLWARSPKFSTLLHIILEQQVSLASANAAFGKLGDQMRSTGITPPAFLNMSDEALRESGFSRQKIRYTRILADRMVEEPQFLECMKSMSDHEAKSHLIQLTGIGVWTADIYISECMLRPDILPKGDIALNEAFKQIKGLETRPDYETLERMTNHWRPYRSVGIRMLWHYYLSEKKK